MRKHHAHDGKLALESIFPLLRELWLVRTRLLLSSETHMPVMLCELSLFTRLLKDFARTMRSVSFSSLTGMSPPPDSCATSSTCATMRKPKTWK